MREAIERHTSVYRGGWLDGRTGKARTAFLVGAAESAP